MSGILEQMNARIEALEAAVRQLAATPTPTASAGLSLGGTTAQTQQTQQQQNVTGEEIMALVQKLVTNEQAKAQLIAHLGSLGVSELPLLPPAQYAQFYALCKQTEAQFFGTGGGLGGGLGTLGGGAATSTNII